MYHQISIKGLTIKKKINLQTIMRYDFDRVELQGIKGVRVMYHQISITDSNNTKKLILLTIMRHEYAPG
jgi:hypothetical protein